MGRALYNFSKHLDNVQRNRAIWQYYQLRSADITEAIAEINQCKKSHIFQSMPNPQDYACWKKVNPGRSLLNTDLSVVKKEISDMRKAGAL